MHKSALIAAALPALMLAFFSPPAACADILEPLIQKSLKEAKEAGAQYAGKACGGYYMVEGQYTKTTPTGITTHPVQRHHIEPWGCNTRPDHEQVTQKFESTSSAKGAGIEEEYIVNALGFFAFDDTPSTEITGRFLDKNQKPVRNAEVKAESIDGRVPTVTGRTDQNGRYSLKVRSGQYRVTANTKSCRAEQTLWACGWGKIPADSKRQESFELNMSAQCAADLTLHIKGTDTTTFNIQVEDLSFSGNSNGGKFNGSIPLTHNPKTGKISGDGIINIEWHGASGNGMTGDGPIDVTADPTVYDMKVKVHGTVDPRTSEASLSIDCAESGPQGIIGGRGTHNGQTFESHAYSDGAPCSGGDWQIAAVMKWENGSTQHIDRHLPVAMGGFTADNHEIIDLRLGDPEPVPGGQGGGGNKPPPSRSEPEPDSQPEPPAPPTGGRRGLSGGIPAPAPEEEEEYPEDVTAEEPFKEEDLYVDGDSPPDFAPEEQELIDQGMDMIRQYQDMSETE